MRDTKNKLSRKDAIAKMRTLMKDKFAQNPQWEGSAPTAHKRSSIDLEVAAVELGRWHTPIAA